MRQRCLSSSQVSCLDALQLDAVWSGAMADRSLLLLHCVWHPAPSKLQACTILPCHPVDASCSTQCPARAGSALQSGGIATLARRAKQPPAAALATAPRAVDAPSALQAALQPMYSDVRTSQTVLEYQEPQLQVCLSQSASASAHLPQLLSVSGSACCSDCCSAGC